MRSASAFSKFLHEHFSQDYVILIPEYCAVIIKKN